MFLGLTKGEHIVASCAPQDPQNIDDFKEFGAFASFDNRPVVEKSDVVLIAVKPQVVPIALAEVKQLVTNRHLFLSVAMGVTVKELETVFKN